MRTLKNKIAAVCQVKLTLICTLGDITCISSMDFLGPFLRFNMSSFFLSRLAVRFGTERARSFAAEICALDQRP